MRERLKWKDKVRIKDGFYEGVEGIVLTEEGLMPWGTGYLIKFQRDRKNKLIKDDIIKLFHSRQLEKI